MCKEEEIQMIEELRKKKKKTRDKINKDYKEVVKK